METNVTGASRILDRGDLGASGESGEGGDWTTGGALRRLVTLAVLACLLIGSGLSGCALSESSGSFSNSSGSVSDSIGSSSDSSTSSSGGDDPDYRDDVRRFTTAAVEAGVTPAALRRGVGEIALERGISDWEAVDGTWIAIREGLARAEATESTRRAYREALAPRGASIDRERDAEPAAPRP